MKKRPTKSKTPPPATMTFLDVENQSSGILRPKNGPTDDGCTSILTPGHGVVAFDPGAMGAFAIFHKGNITVLPNASTYEMRCAIACCKYHIVEKVSAMPGQGVTSMFNFGMNYQKCLSACEINADGDEFYVGSVTPQTWQNYFTMRHFVTLPAGKEFQSQRKKMLVEIAKKQGLDKASKPLKISDKDASDAFLILIWTLRKTFSYR